MRIIVDFGNTYTIFSIPHAEQRAYYVKYVTSDILNHVAQIAVEVQDELINSLTSSEWFDSNSCIPDRVKEIQIFVGAPDGLLQDALEDQYSSVS